MSLNLLDVKRVLKKIWSGWKKVALKVARFQTAVLLTLFYFVILVPLGLMFKSFGWDPLEARQKKLNKATNWKLSFRGEPSLKDMRRQS
jgi:hypothetical protein